jgi:ABC-type uncharacterized transport system permease subunit
MENQAATVQPQKKSLVSRKAWGVIAIISALLAVSLRPGTDIATMAGRFIGGLLIFGGIWALIMGTSRWLSRRRMPASTRK